MFSFECRGLCMFFPTLSITLNEQLCEDKYSDFFCTVEEKKKRFWIHSCLLPSAVASSGGCLMFFSSSHCALFLTCLEMGLRKELSGSTQPHMATSVLTLGHWPSLHRAPWGIPGCTGAVVSRMALTLYPVTRDNRKRTKTLCRGCLISMFSGLCLPPLKTWCILGTCPWHQLLAAPLGML